MMRAMTLAELQQPLDGKLVGGGPDYVLLDVIVQTLSLAGGGPDGGGGAWTVALLVTIATGLGVALLNTRHPAAPLPDHRWEGVMLPGDLPEVSLVARRSNRSRDAAVRSLLSELVDGFRDETIQVASPG